MPHINRCFARVLRCVTFLFVALFATSAFAQQFLNKSYQLQNPNPPSLSDQVTFGEKKVTMEFLDFNTRQKNVIVGTYTFDGRMMTISAMGKTVRLAYQKTGTNTFNLIDEEGNIERYAKCGSDEDTFFEELMRRTATLSPSDLGFGPNGSFSGSSAPVSTDCMACFGRGRCRACSGRGYLVSPYNGQPAGTCPSCGGSGKCPSCNGTGHR